MAGHKCEVRVAESPDALPFGRRARRTQDPVGKPVQVQLLSLALPIRLLQFDAARCKLMQPDTASLNVLGRNPITGAPHFQCASSLT
jgi:hypothetical protein